MTDSLPAHSDEDEEFRLPRTVSPRRYDLRLAPDLEAATFTGQERVTVEVHEPVREIVLNAIELEIADARLADTGGGTGPAAIVEMDRDRQRAVLRFGDQIEPGEHVLEISFSGILNDKLRGFYRSTFTDTEGTQHVIATTQFESTDARRAFPCWDEPDRKAVFSITLDVPAGMLAVSNSPVVRTEDLTDGRRRFAFGDTIAMSTYIVAFVVGNLEITDPVDVDGIPLSVVHPPGKGHLTGFALEAGAHALRFFVDWFGIPYPGEKLDLIAIPDFAAGAMENLGAVTFREAEVLIDSADAAQTELERIAEVIEHEIAHMWFGDLVTMRWWNGIWLNEAFATFMSLLCQDDFRPEWKPWVSFARLRAAAMQIDSLGTTRPIEYPVRAPEEAEGMFDLLTYEKGASVLRMIERFLGADRFREGVRSYLRGHLYSNTETTDLWDAIEAVAGDQPIRAIMDSWIFQGGYPLVHAAAGEAGDLYLSEEPFSLLRPTDEDEPVPTDESAWPHGPFAPEESAIGENWLVPVVVALREGWAPSSFGELAEEAQGTRRVVLAGEGATLRLSEAGEPPLGALTIVNAGGHGFYRVRYDNDLFGDVAANLDRLERLERFALVSDTWACTLAGVSELASFVDLTSRLGRETDASVWAIVLGAIGRLDHAVADHHRRILQSWVHDLLTPQLERVGWDAVAGEDPQTPVLRASLISTLGTIADDPGVRARCAELFEAAKTGRRALDADIARSVLAVVAQASGKEEFDIIRDRYRKAASPQEEQRNLDALSQFRDASLAAETHEMCLGEIRTQDAPYVMLQSLMNRHVRVQAWDFVRQHFAEMEARYPRPSIPGMLRGISSLDEVDAHGSSPLAESVRAFVAEHPMGGVQRLVDQQLEMLDVNIAFIRRERPGMGALLERR